MKWMQMSLLFGALTVGLTACPAAGTVPPPAQVSASGTWEGTEVYPAQNGAAADSLNVRYIINDNNGTLGGTLTACADGSFNCSPVALTGTRNGNAVTLKYGSTLEGSGNPITITTQATLNGNVISGTTTYPASSSTFIGTTTLTKK